jgi:hypothetical protein
MSPKRTFEGSAEPGGGPAFLELLGEELEKGSTDKIETEGTNCSA